MNRILGYILAQSIRTQISGSIFAMVLLVVVFMVIFFPLRQRNQANRSLESKGISLAEMLAYNLGPGLEFNDSRYIEEAVKGAKQNKDIIAIYVTDLSGKEIFSYLREGVTRHPLQPAYINTSVTKTEEAICVATLITGNNGVLGSLMLDLSSSESEKEIRSSLQTAVMAGALVVLLGMLVGYYLAKRLTEPLQKLRNAAEGLSQGHLEVAIKVHSSMEMKSLVQSFNQMNCNMGQYQEQLREQSRTLENKVNERTAQLMKTNEELKAAQSYLLQSEKMASIGQLAAGVAHEINNPMGFIISNLNSLQKYTGKIVDFIKAIPEMANKASGDHRAQCDAFLEQLTKQKQEMGLDYIMGDLANLVKESLEGADRVKNIVQNLKSFSHINESELKMADINTGIENTVNIIWNELKYKATMKKTYGDIPHTLCNPGQLNQVFMNVLINAVQAISKQGEITVKTWHDDGRIYVAISDTGAGIPADKIDRIFEPFYTTKEVGKGTGLGLSIVYDIIKKHHAEIRVESEVGKGSTFTVVIPIVGEKTQP